MLVLSRRIGEEVVVGEDINIIVLGMKGGQVKIGFDAPIEIPVHRKEIKDRIDAEKEAIL